MTETLHARARWTPAARQVVCALGLTLVALASAADEPLSTVPAAGYAAGKATGLTPLSDGERFDCAVQWDVWHTAFISKIMPKDIEDALPIELSAPASDSAKLAWRKRVAKSRETTPMMVTLDIISKTPQRDRHQASVMAGLRSDAKALFRVTQSLGICGKPAL